MRKLLVVVACAFVIFSFVSCSNEHDQPTTETIAQEQTVNNQTVVRKYVASKNSNKYHKLSCRYVNNIKRENLVYYEYEYQAKEDGKEPCSECRP